jgi:hypothetical protein
MGGTSHSCDRESQAHRDSRLKAFGRFLIEAVLLFGAAEKPFFNIGGIPHRQSQAPAFTRVKTANLAGGQKRARPLEAITASVSS